MERDSYGVVELPLGLVEPNRDQPRKHFDRAALEELAASIEKYGVIEPIVVMDMGDHYRIIAGERRWRASRIAHKRTIPVIIKSVSEKELAEIALIENIQREDLNPIEEAKAYKRYCDMYGATQEILAQILSKDRSSVAHAMRLLKLPDEVQEMLAEGKISTGHGKDLLSIDDPEEQVRLAKVIAEKKLSVSAAKKELKKKKAKKDRKTYSDAFVENSLTEKLGLKVSVKRSSTKGTLSLEFYTEDELSALYDLLSAT